MQTPDVSIIIPVFNAERYLSRCLESARGQTLKNIEIICVNDASSDASGLILKKHAAEDARMKVLTLEENKGESYARNLGIRHARGKYIGSIDNDDKVDLNFFERLFDAATKKGADIVKGNCLEIDATNGRVTPRYINEDVRTNKMCFSYQWWTAIYRREFLLNNDITFPEELCLGGDIVFLVKSLIKSNSVEALDDIFYYYYRRPDSGDSKTLPTRKVESIIKAYGQIFYLLNEYFPSHLTREGYDFFYSRYFYILAIHITERSEHTEDKQKCTQAVMQYLNLCKHPDVLISKLDPVLGMLDSNLYRALLRYKIKNKIIPKRGHQ